jgi:DNA-binding response OmpR family regulator
MIQILLVEDDPILGRSVCIFLELSKYKIHWAQDLKNAYRINESEKIDLVILDQGLPDGSGLTFLKDLRKSGSTVPVLILTAKSDEDSVVEGLQSGANDYIRKPFGNRELLARIKVATKEPETASQQVRYDDLALIMDQRRVLYRGNEIELNRREFDVLSHFIKNAEAVVTREALLDTLDPDADLNDRTIDSHISHVRARLRNAGVGSVVIRSIYGVGYRLERK